MPSTVDITALKGLSASFRVLMFLLYQNELEGVERYSNGLVIISRPTKFCKYVGSGPSYLRLYLTLLNNAGIIKRLSCPRGKFRFYINRPPIFKYADVQSIPEGVEQLSETELANYAQFKQKFTPEVLVTNEELAKALIALGEKIDELR